MSGVNKAIIVGNLGNDPEVRHSVNGSAIANITVATSESWTDKNSGQKQEKTEWHRIVMFNKLGEIAGEYLRKGSKVYIEGKIQTRKWQDQNGNDKYTTEIVASTMQMIDTKGSDSSSSGAGSGSQANRNGQGGVQAPQAANNNGFDDNSDIPF